MATRMRWLLVCSYLIIILAGCAADNPASPMDEIDGYQEWTTLTDEPRDVSSYIMGLCRMPTEMENELVGSEHGWSRHVWDYVNDVGVATIREEGPRTFPVGTIIVKEKFFELEDDEAGALGIMIKHGPGFNPQGGDWEFLYWERASGLQHDTEYDNTCQKCHAAVSDSDFVFFPRSAAAVGMQFGMNNP